MSALRYLWGATRGRHKHEQTSHRPTGGGRRRRRRRPEKPTKPSAASEAGRRPKAEIKLTADRAPTILVSEHQAGWEAPRGARGVGKGEEARGRRRRR